MVPSVLDKEIEIKKFKEIICTTSHTSVVADFKPQLSWVPPPYLVSRAFCHTYSLGHPRKDGRCGVNTDEFLSLVLGHLNS